MKIREDPIAPSQWARPRRAIREHRAIVLHWYLNPGQLASSVVSYWDSRSDGLHGFGSGHYAIDDVEAIMAVPPDEIAYHVGSENYTDFAEKYLEGSPNYYTVAIEFSHPDMTGKPTDTVWERGVGLATMLCKTYAIPVDMIVTHFDITDMRPHWNSYPCHRWMVEQPGELVRFQQEVKERL